MAVSQAPPEDWDARCCHSDRCLPVRQLLSMQAHAHGSKPQIAAADKQWQILDQS